jgi:hypothetical protein
MNKILTGIPTDIEANFASLTKPQGNGGDTVITGLFHDRNPWVGTLAWLRDLDLALLSVHSLGPKSAHYPPETS